MFNKPFIYSRQELLVASRRALDRFKTERYSEELRWAQYYDSRFKAAKESVHHILLATRNLYDLETKCCELLAAGYLPILRYMDRPTVSSDDFKNLSGTGTVSAGKLKDGELARLASDFISRNLNGALFPWLGRGDDPSDAEISEASHAVAALIADQQTKTAMRKDSSQSQERAVRDAVINDCGFHLVDGSDFSMQSGAPKSGEIFTKETKVAGTKADVVLGLYDERFMCLECKVSNSEVNSYKRLNHEVVEKVERWKQQFGKQCVSGAVLQGCFKVDNLLSAQECGASIFWSSDLTSLIQFIESTKK